MSFTLRGYSLQAHVVAESEIVLMPVDADATGGQLGRGGQLRKKLGALQEHALQLDEPARTTFSKSVSETGWAETVHKKMV